MSTAPIWITVKHDDNCKCGAKLAARDSRAAYDFDNQEYVACEACSPEANLKVEVVSTQAPTQSPLSNLVSAVERFARANGAADRVDAMLAAIMRAASK